jgi:hypothetical protein
MDTKRSPAPYITAGLIFLAGVIGFAVFLFLSLAGMGKNLIQVVVPGEQEIHLSEPGAYTVFHEYRSSVGGRVYSGPEGLPGLECTLTSKKTGAAVPLSPALSASRYDYGGRSGVSVLEFAIAEPGDYVFKASYPQGQTASQAVLAIDHGFIGRILLTVFGGFAILFGSLVVSLTIVVVTLVKRSRLPR